MVSYGAVSAGVDVVDDPKEPAMSGPHAPHEPDRPPVDGERAHQREAGAALLLGALVLAVLLLGYASLH
jgi:hypothetical protein